MVSIKEKSRILEDKNSGHKFQFLHRPSPLNLMHLCKQNIMKKKHVQKHISQDLMMTSHGNGIILGDCICLVRYKQNFLFTIRNRKDLRLENHTNNFPSATLATLSTANETTRRRLSLWFLCRSSFPCPATLTRPLWRDQELTAEVFIRRSSIHDRVQRYACILTPVPSLIPALSEEERFQALSFQQGPTEHQSGQLRGPLRMAQKSQLPLAEEPQLSARLHCTAAHRLW